MRLVRSIGFLLTFVSPTRYTVWSLYSCAKEHLWCYVSHERSLPYSLYNSYTQCLEGSTQTLKRCTKFPYAYTTLLHKNGIFTGAGLSYAVKWPSCWLDIPVVTPHQDREIFVRSQNADQLWNPPSFLFNIKAVLFQAKVTWTGRWQLTST